MIKLSGARDAIKAMTTKGSLKRFLSEGKCYTEKGDSVQASDKLCKAAEESIETLPESVAPEMHKEAMGKGKLTRHLLSRAADKMDGEITHCWDSAWTLHAEGFRKMGLRISSVQKRGDDIAELVELVEN